MVQEGIAVTLNADDPLEFGVMASAEYALVRDVFGFSDEQLASIAKTSVLASGASEATRARMLHSIQEWGASKHS